MEKLLRILFVMCAIAFVTTLTACADDAKKKNVVKPPSFLKFTSTGKGVTIDTTKNVYKITINPSLLTYDTPAVGVGVGVAAMNPADIFTVTFTDAEQQGFIIPTTADRAAALKTTHVADLDAAITADKVVGKVTAEGLFLGAPNNVTHSFLANDAADDPVFGFSATELNAAWSTLAPRAEVISAVAAGGGKPAIEAQDEFDGVTDIMTDTKVRVSCVTTMTGINKDSFKKKTPAAKDDLAIDKGTETVCAFSLVSDGADDDAKKTAYKDWAKKVVAAAKDKDTPTKNRQKIGFLGIVTGDDKASVITKKAGDLLTKDISAETGAKLVALYDGVLQKVEIVIAVAK